MKAHYLSFILLLLPAYAAFLTWEAARARRDRAKLKHVIYVNGTRGKSTVTRMIDAGLRGMGCKVLCKTTGTIPLCIHVDGREDVVERTAPANVREQLTFLHMAAEEGADVLVIECMALDPLLQRISSRRMLRADVGVITNARLDHTDVMGQTREEILDCLMEMLPERGMVFTAERELFAQVRERCETLGSSVELALPEQAAGMEALDFPDNTALALCVCRTLTEGSDAQLLQGIAAFRRDPYALSVHQLGGLRLVNALSANDVESTRLILDRYRGGEEERLILLINNRTDRPARARDMARLCRLIRPDEVWLLGEQQHALANLCRRGRPDLQVRGFAAAEELPLTQAAQSKTLLLAVGNIKNEGVRLVERAKQDMTQVGNDRQ